MKMLVASVHVLACVSVLLFHCGVRGDDICGSDKSAENQVVLDKENETRIINKYKLPRMTCAWQITAPPGYRVAFWARYCHSKTYKTFNITAYDGNSPSNVLLWDSSGLLLYPFFTLFSSSESLRVILKTGNDTASSSCFYGSVYAVLAQDCINDQVFHVNASLTVGNFKSPYYPSGYPANVSCGWRIQATRGKVVKLRIEKSKVECNSLHVYDGEDEKPENLVWPKSCNDLVINPGVVFFSYGQTFFVRFKSVSRYLRNSYYHGFMAQHSAVDPGYMCGNGSSVVNSTYGIISTPGFPSNVPSRALTCVWSVTAPVGHVIRLDLDTISLYDKTPNCPKIEVKNFQGSRLQAFECSNYMANTFVFRERKLQIKFTKPEYKPSRSVGIIGKYKVIPLEITGSCGANRVGTINLKGEAAAFHSLNYPNEHPGNMSCTWSITVTAGQVIELRLDTSLGYDCNKNSIKIYDGPTKSSRLIKKLCRSEYAFVDPPLYASNNRLLLEFSGQVPSKGFLARYVARSAVPKPYACSTNSLQRLKGMEGKLASWGFPQSYINNVHCEWLIEVPAHHIVKLTVLSLDLQPDASCSRDFLRLVSEDNSELAKLCGKNGTRLAFKSSTRQMTVEFQSDATETYPGFEAMFQAVSWSTCPQQNPYSYLLSMSVFLWFSINAYWG